MCSPDGIHFTEMFGKPVVAGSDTQNIAFFDEFTQRYVGYIRIDNILPPEHPPNETCSGEAQAVGHLLRIITSVLSLSPCSPSASTSNRSLRSGHEAGAALALHTERCFRCLHF